MFLITIASVLSLVQADAPAAPGSALRPGMVLVYESNGKAQPPWTVVAVTADPRLKDGAACAIVQIRRGPTPPDPPAVRLCVEGGMVLQWSDVEKVWQPQRPVSGGRTLRLPRPNGESVLYETEEASQATIGGIAVPVVLTTVTTLDASGRPVRRLRERYATSLTTAIDGEFEVADSGTASGFRTTQSFVLREIK
jgi:hypothetical protein